MRKYLLSFTLFLFFFLVSSSNVFAEEYVYPNPNPDQRTFWTCNPVGYNNIIDNDSYRPSQDCAQTNEDVTCGSGCTDWQFIGQTIKISGGVSSYYISRIVYNNVFVGKANTGGNNGMAAHINVYTLNNSGNINTLLGSAQANIPTANCQCATSTTAYFNPAISVTPGSTIYFELVPDSNQGGYNNAGNVILVPLAKQDNLVTSFNPKTTTNAYSSGNAYFGSSPRNGNLNNYVHTDSDLASVQVFGYPNFGASIFLQAPANDPFPIYCSGGSIPCDAPPKGLGFNAVTNGNNIKRIEIYVRKQGGSWVNAGIKTYPQSPSTNGAAPAFYDSNNNGWNPPSTGTYTATVNVYLWDGTWCTGNPDSSATCGDNSYMTINVRDVNCSHLSYYGWPGVFSKQITAGSSQTFSADYVSLTSGFNAAISACKRNSNGTVNTSCVNGFSPDTPYQLNNVSGSSITSFTQDLTFNNPGTYDVVCRAWKTSESKECRGSSDYLGNNSNVYLCPGPTTLRQIEVLPVPPTINSLQLGNASTPSRAGTFGISGLQSSQGGSNWLNPMTVVLDANAGSGNLAESYLAMYDNTLTQITDKASFVATAKSNASLKKGILLGKGSGVNGGGANDYYIWDPFLNGGNWLKLTTSMHHVCDGTCSDATRLYSVSKNPTNGWNVTYDKNFGSRNLYTAGYVKNNYGLDSLSVDIAPSPIP